MYSPHLVRALNKLKKIIHEQLYLLNIQRVVFPNLGTKENWDKLDRWSAFGDHLFTLKDRNLKEFCLQPVD